MPCARAFTRTHQTEWQAALARRASTTPAIGAGAVLPAPMRLPLAHPPHSHVAHARHVARVVLPAPAHHCWPCVGAAPLFHSCTYSCSPLENPLCHSRPPHRRAIMPACFVLVMPAGHCGLPFAIFPCPKLGCSCASCAPKVWRLHRWAPLHAAPPVNSNRIEPQQLTQHQELALAVEFSNWEELGRLWRCPAVRVEPGRA